MVKGCIFDLDGVIVDTAKYHYLAWSRLAKELGFTFTPGQNERLKGVSRMKSLDILLEIGGLNFSESEKERLAAQKNQWYVEYILQMTPDEILPGAREFLQDLKLNHIKIALGSASKNAVTILEHIQLKDYFDAIIDGTKVSKAKPDPEVFLKAASALCLKPQDCVVFEDALAGIEAAKNGHMHCIGVGSPKILSQADLVIPSLAKIDIETLHRLHS